MSSEIILVKSCSEVGKKYIDFLSILCKKRIVITGPLIADSNDEEENSYIMDWLSGKGHHSTVYISFGSMPMKSEQPLNAGLMLEVGVGVEVVRERNGQYLGKEMAKAIDKVIVDKAFCEVLRCRGTDLSEKIKEKKNKKWMN
ncbi:hypothetical protein RD792_017172 [Penstemon davidsonii]|uniref:Uncharacterized protein n=1 Tax=Penstemon davidsonii TaxID=160366 RepID=A0ABR0CLP4_9LAMI|nr:hypothetical protein RD792_017172 [Penstemon davidsonii]